MPVHQNLVMADEDSAIRAPRGTLAMAVCAGCGFIFNRDFDPAKVTYGEGYDNDQSHSAYYDAYTDTLAARILESGIGNATIVEVGCGNGGFLRKLMTSGNRGIGFDPSYTGPDSALGGRLTFQRRYYDSRAAAVKADMVICRHVIEHVPDPIALLRTIRSAAADARVFFETPCVDWILRNTVVWDFFYEHCSLFSADTLAYACARAGFATDDVQYTFGGQYLWLQGRSSAPAERGPRNAAEVVRQAQSYTARFTRLCEEWSRRLAGLRARGAVALWGAGAKGATFANLLDPGRVLIDCVVDINPNKQGRYIQGTGHRIVAPTDLAGRRVRSAILLNPNYRKEVAALLAGLGADVELVDWG